MSRSVVPGEWYAVLGEEVVVLLPAPAKARVAAVWELVDEGAGFDEVLDGLISGGLRDLPGFVLVSETEGDVKVVIRGAGVAELATADGPVTVAGDAGSTWVERQVAGVTALRVQVADDDRPSYALETGLVRVSSVQQPAATQGGLAPPPAETSEEPPPVEAEPAPAAPTPQPAPPAVPAPVARLVFSSGEVVDVDRPVVIGRAPHPRGDGDDGVLLVSVPSPHQEISSTHVEIRPGSGPDLGAAVATDLGSTNGTLLIQPGRPAEDLQPGIGVRLVPGAVVDLGEGATIRVAAADLPPDDDRR